ncbi:MAG: DNA polymerase III subunit delta' [Thermodesulfobacteriota bacterium]
MSFTSITGHHNQVEVLSKAILNNRVSHSYLFIGPEGVGKKLTAISFAKTLNCKGTRGDFCDECISCKKINGLTHPDVEIIEPEGRFIKIERIRELQKRLQYKSLEGRFKVSILDGVEKMNPAASNALLKTLEEPPQDSILILISSQGSSLLPTLVSRCQRFTFHPLKGDDMIHLIKKNGVEDEIASLLVSFGQGSIGRALSINREWLLKERKVFLEMIKDVIRGDMETAFQLTEDIYKDDALMDYLEVLKIWIRDILVYKHTKDKESIVNTDLLYILKKENESLSCERLQHIFHGVNECQGDILKNANKRLALEVMFMRLGEKWLES